MICQLMQNQDLSTGKNYVHQGEAEVNIAFKGRLILMLTEKNPPIVLLYTLSLFLIYIKTLLINLLKCTENKLISTIAFQVSETLF